MITTKLLIVDDEKRFLQTTSNLISRQRDDFKLFTAEGGSQCFEIMEENSIDVVILDVKMPEMNGIDVLRKIKANWPLTEVIMLTGHSTTDSAVEGMKLGAFDYLLKPCDITLLVEKVLEADQRKKYAEEKINNAKINRIVKEKGF
jgi:DNA-binding NtrC family response regulator